jgi:CRISPR-associated protein Csb2
MLALGIRYLTGYAVATDPANRNRAEWPPHPGRTFMALAAAHFETGEDPTERAALEWLETQPAPGLMAPEADERAVVTHYVPVNDKAGPARGLLQSLPGITRGKQPRTYPRVRPHDDTVWLIWPDADPDEEFRRTLAGLCEKVTYIGHSSSLVQVWLSENGAVPNSTWIPDPHGSTLQLRVPGRGTLAYLRDRFAAAAIAEFERLDRSVRQSKGKARREAMQSFEETLGVEWRRNVQPPPRLRPVLSMTQGYRAVEGPQEEPPLTTIFDPGIVVLRLEATERSLPTRLGLETTLRLTDILRRALMRQTTELGLDSVPAIISGHEPDGTPLDRPHIAYVPLGFVGREHADGHLLGVGVIFPRPEHWPEQPRERRQILTALARVRTLKLGGLGVWRLVPEVREAPAYNLVPSAWTASRRGAAVWGTVTPIAFDRHPKAGSRAEYQREVTAMIRRACTRIGLPEPSSVQIGPVSPHLGTPASRDYPRLPRKDGSERRHTHATLVFERPVRGPVILGAGRFRGYGLCRPLREGRES